MSVYIQVQHTSAQNVSVPAGSNLPFNAVKTTTGGISCDMTGGAVRLETSGTYFVTWTIAVEDITFAPIDFAITADGVTVSESASSIMNGIAVGSAIIQANSIVKVNLKNISSFPVKLLAGAVSATLTAYQISSGGNRVIIPFSTGESEPSKPGVDAYGVPTFISLLESGAYSPQLTVNDNAFEIPFGRFQRQFLFSLPYDATLVAISANFNNYSSLTLPSVGDAEIRPYLAIATRSDDTDAKDIFHILPDSKVPGETGYQYNGTTYPDDTIITANQTGLSVAVPAGKSIAIVVGLDSIGTQHHAFMEWLFIHGSLVFELA